VDRSQVARWATGADHVPADILVHLADHTGAPVEIFSILTRACNCEVVQVPDGAVTGREVTVASLQLGAAVGRLQAAVADATDPDSDGGADFTALERAALTTQVHDLVQRLMDLARGLETQARTAGKAAKRRAA
jgi:hypothetical protein